MNLSREHLRLIYQEHGIIFQSGKAVLSVGAGNKLLLDEAILLEPSEDSIQSLVKHLNSLDIEYELFDIKDPQYETNIEGVWHRSLGRILHHFEWDFEVVPPKRINYFTYATLEADSSQVSRDSWEKMLLYLLCVIATLGILIFFGLITAGMSVYATVFIFSAVAASCVAAMRAVVPENEQRNARVVTHVGT